jgi:hypothetical protein
MKSIAYGASILISLYILGLVLYVFTGSLS